MLSSEIIFCLSVPLTAIILSFLTKKVSLSLGTGIFLGSIILIFHKGQSFVFVSKIIGGAFIDTSHLRIITFTILISLMVHVMVLHGHITTIATRLLRFAKTRKSAQLITWFMGLIIFFDDYANTLIVGNTLQPITDRFRISREKLAYIVDSTAAPVASIALISTWIGAEVGHIESNVVHSTSSEAIPLSAYEYFLNSLSYSYYPIFTLAFILITIFSNREFGPMLKAKPVYSFIRTKKTETNTTSILRAITPIIGLLVASISVMIYTGLVGITNGDYGSINIIKHADSELALLIGSIVSFLLANSYKKEDLISPEFISTLKEGLKKIQEPLIILMLAWILGSIIKQLGTGDCIATLLPTDTTPYILPGLIFLVSALVSFAIGSSFSTMGIMYSIALPLVHSICLANGFLEAETLEITYHTIACVLAGAVFGDHCSPISDTTVLSSLACDCNHLSHVKTQMPYAIAVGSISAFISFTVANTGMPPIFIFTLGILFLYLIVRVFGRHIRT